MRVFLRIKLVKTDGSDVVSGEQNIVGYVNFVAFHV